MPKSIEEIKDIDLTDSDVFADAITKAEGQLYFALCNHFSVEMHKAIKGRICTLERMILLYPIFREINIEMEEIDNYWKRYDKMEAEIAK